MEVLFRRGSCSRIRAQNRDLGAEIGPQAPILRGNGDLEGSIAVERPRWLSCALSAATEKPHLTGNILSRKLAQTTEYEYIAGP